MRPRAPRDHLRRGVLDMEGEDRLEQWKDHLDGETWSGMATRLSSYCTVVRKGGSLWSQIGNSIPLKCEYLQYFISITEMEYVQIFA